MIVVDASLMVAWLLREPALRVVPDLYQRLPREAIVVPGHWSIEIASALWTNLRRGRLPLEAFDALLDSLSMFQITAGAPVSLDEIGTLTRFAIAQNLTVYDAAYVQLAARLGAPLATLDEAMRVAGRRLDISLIPA